ncbi:MAG: GspE/PulE family protein [Clostridiales bacterium]|jgi:type IV pilus assembly protein PilB|nr:GspE/PulE family protein [Clostridiales bacterium]
MKLSETAKKLAELFVKFGLITEEQANSALLVNKLMAANLDQLNIASLTRGEVIQLLSNIVGVPYIEFEDHEISPEAVVVLNESTARKHSLVPLVCNDTTIRIAMSDPLNLVAIDDVAMYTGLKVEPYFASAVAVNNSISIHYGRQEALQAAEEYQKEQQAYLDELEENSDNIEENISNAPIVKMLNSIIEQAVRMSASDIHIEAFSNFIRIRFRLDGELKTVMNHDLRLLSALITRLKITANMNIAETRRPQDGRFTRKIENITYDFRVSVIPAVLGEKAVVRIINKENLLRAKNEIITLESDEQKLDEILSVPHGMVIITGPTGSGKSTTMYTIISEKNDEDVNILTVEDPIEAVIDGINQIQVNNKANVTFANSLRAFLRQDPDVIVVGEVRDNETAEIAIRAAVTGHLVISTLHTNNSVSTIIRLIDMGIEPMLLASSMVGVISQRLVRKICPHCKESYTPSPQEIEFLDLPKPPTKLYRGKGCKACANSGYKGRMATFEILHITPEFRKHITRNANSDDLQKIAIETGMDTLKTNCTKLVLKGETSFEELLKISYEV